MSNPLERKTITVAGLLENPLVSLEVLPSCHSIKQTYPPSCVRVAYKSRVNPSLSRMQWNWPERLRWFFFYINSASRLLQKLVTASRLATHGCCHQTANLARSGRCLWFYDQWLTLRKPANYLSMAMSTSALKSMS